jgi:hypothetical protein
VFGLRGSGYQRVNSELKGVVGKMRLRKRSRSERALDYVVEAPWWQRATALAIPAAAGIGAAAYAGRKRIRKGFEALRGATRRSATA